MRDNLDLYYSVWINNLFSATISDAVDWKEHVYGTKFNLAPRGFGRSSFRLAE